ncbi:hypothetical protein [Pedobacter cryoconitis]|uniref:Secreted protein n=1 Tax=Pedobacter cryoconitis TaxID=188932 RepID=A0A327TB98_9SPHI|nr:hypothetical protein [Pedobacter cryoconitis]RAJ37384.1 hypothetical protein LY11_00461 [Pedobacter cryoconitis]
MENSEYSIQLTSEPQHIVPAQDTVLTLTHEKPLKLEISHEKKIHLIIVNEDLSYFNHIHPVETEKGYTVKTKFPSSGKFHLFADYKPSGSDQVVNKLEVSVPGKAPSAEEYNKEKLTGNSGAYSITLVADQGKFTSGHMMIAGILKKDGKEIDPLTLANYLGAKAHVVLISVDDKEYIHAHPEVENGRYKLHASFPKPGIYRGWIQFQTEDIVHTTDYVIQVVQQRGNSESGH